MNKNILKRSIYLPSSLFVCFLCFACQANKNSFSYQSQIEEPDVVEYNFKKEDEKVEIEDSIAIGNIKMGCSRSEFYRGKREFLNKHKKLAGIEIESFEPTCINGELVRIEIKSKRRQGAPNSNFWNYLYSNKYSKINTFYFKKGFLRIYVNDGEDFELDQKQTNEDGIIDLTKNPYAYTVRSVIRIDNPRLIEDVNTQKENARMQKKQEEFDDI